MTDTQKEEKDNYKTRKFKGLMFDGRIDQTKVVEKVDVAGVIKHTVKESFQRSIMLFAIRRETT